MGVIAVWAELRYAERSLLCGLYWLVKTRLSLEEYSIRV